MQQELKRVRETRVDENDLCIEFLLHSATGRAVRNCKDPKKRTHKDLKELERWCVGLESKSTLIIDMDRRLSDSEDVQCALNAVCRPPHTVYVPWLCGADGTPKIWTNVAHTLNVTLRQYPVLQIVCAVIVRALDRHCAKGSRAPLFQDRGVAATVQQAVDKVRS